MFCYNLLFPAFSQIPWVLLWMLLVPHNRHRKVDFLMSEPWLPLLLLWESYSSLLPRILNIFFEALPLASCCSRGFALTRMRCKILTMGLESCNRHWNSRLKKAEEILLLQDFSELFLLCCALWTSKGDPVCHFPDLWQAVIPFC